MDAPLTLFVWSKSRIVPVKITEFSVTEEMFDSNLNPIRARISLGLRVLTDNLSREVDAPLGLSVLEIAHRNKIDIEGACEGSLACSTCHVIVDPEWFARLTTPTEDEEDMLDLAFGLEKTSRLGCQIVMSEALDGLVVRLPAATRNAAG